MGFALFVDLFFCISGFVIAYIYHSRVNTALGYFTFLRRRIGRLVPLHWLTLFMSIAIWSLFVFNGYKGEHTPSFNATCIAETAMLTHSFTSCGNESRFNGVSWSISVEMVMYIFFPIIAYIGAKSAHLIFGVGVLALAVITAISISPQSTSLLEVLWTDQSQVIRAVPSFVLGAALFYNRQVVIRLPFPEAILVIGVIGLIAAMLSGTSQLLILMIVYLIAIASVAADLNGHNSIIIRKVAPLGQLTYSLYMWHGLFILVIMNAIGDKLLHGAALSTFFLATICYISIFITSYFSLNLIETPARRWIDGLKLK